MITGRRVPNLTPGNKPGAWRSRRPITPLTRCRKPTQAWMSHPSQASP